MGKNLTLFIADMNLENQFRQFGETDIDELKSNLLLEDNLEELKRSVQMLATFCVNDASDEDTGDSEGGSERPLNAIDKKFRRNLSVVSDELNSNEPTPEKMATTLHLLVEDATCYLFDVLPPNEKRIMFPIVAELYEKLISILNIKNTQGDQASQKPLSELTKEGQIADIDWDQIMRMASEISNQLSFLE